MLSVPLPGTKFGRYGALAAWLSVCLLGAGCAASGALHRGVDTVG